MAMTSHLPLTVLVRIPKTAGTSFSTVLSREFGRDRIVDTPYDDTGDGRRTFLALDEARQNAVSVVRGHINYGLHEAVDRPVVYITFLRDPLQRLRSYLNQMAVEAQQHQHITDSSWYNAARNWTSYSHYRETHPDQNIDNDMVRKISGIDFEPGECTPQILATAKENLEVWFRAFGLTHRFDESLVLMHAACGWKRLPVYARAKVEGARGERYRDINLSAEEAAEAEEHNKFDRELLEFACQLFQTRVAGCPLAAVKAMGLRTLEPVVTAMKSYYTRRAR